MNKEHKTLHALIVAPNTFIWTDTEKISDEYSQSENQN